MKTNLVRMAVLVVAAVTMAVPAFAVQTQAGREILPDPNDWEYQAALETGNLPSNMGGLNAGRDPAADVTTVGIGGMVYRVGIDTP
ncbi:MAG: hypothetical protein Q8O78_02635 [Candidatus Deferrimicrobium sp.]|nr:hypothetical protein [Candidatus Deferrimicrobium sp.]